MRVIYVVTSGLCNKFAFAAKDKAEDFAKQVDGVVDVVPYDASIGYAELADD